MVSMQRERMKKVLLQACIIVILTFALFFLDHIKEMCLNAYCMCSTIIFLHSTNLIIQQICGPVVAVAAVVSSTPFIVHH